MRILHLSDFHLRGDGGLSFRVVDTRECLETAAKHLRSLEQRPDAVVLTGDLADSGDAKAYGMLREALEPLHLPVYAVPGNHDRRDRMRDILGPWCPGDPAVAPCLCYVVEEGPVRLVMLDTMQPGSHSGHFPEAVAVWLERVLAARPGAPTLLFMHHPPFVTGMGAMDEPFENVERFEAILRAAPWVRLCCGHMHRPIVTQWAGCLAMTAPCPCRSSLIFPPKAVTASAWKRPATSSITGKAACGIPTSARFPLCRAFPAPILLSVP
ncbi:phosphodiesterase [uncultured Bilophila sp.]|uniref:phosphodiesterase n=1 Tax=uncultured Bilophila sp. TaxID=529385 RepID=UPI00261B6803|nr:phosphodiesterase [uncultured Bilophila sp.]